MSSSPLAVHETHGHSLILPSDSLSRFVAGSGRRPPHQNPNGPLTPLCQLSPAAEMPSHRLTTRSCQLRTRAPQQTILPGVGRTSTTHTTTQGTRPQFDWVRTTDGFVMRLVAISSM